MKKFLIVFLILFFTFNAFSQNEILGKRNGSIDIDFDYKTITGSDSSFAAGEYEAVIIGVTDTIVSRYWSSWGNDMALQLDISGGTTQSFYCIIQAANRNNETFADSLFKTMYWVEFAGNSAVLSAVSTTAVKISTTGITTPLIVPPLGADTFRLFIYSDGSQVGNTVIKASIARRD